MCCQTYINNNKNPFVTFKELHVHESWYLGYVFNNHIFLLWFCIRSDIKTSKATNEARSLLGSLDWEDGGVWLGLIKANQRLFILIRIVRSVTGIVFNLEIEMAWGELSAGWRLPLGEVSDKKSDGLKIPIIFVLNFKVSVTTECWECSVLSTCWYFKLNSEIIRAEQSNLIEMKF